MIVKNNYNECLTNLACSIRKYFELDYKHNTIDYIDKILEEYKPKNVVTILCDGMGSNIMDRMLDKNSFLIKNRIKPITTVFPATTVAATTSMLTGLNPCETAMLGWDMYYKDLDKVITTYLNCSKEDSEEKVLEEAVLYNKKHMITKSIMEEINEIGKYKGYRLFPFGEGAYKDLDDLFNIIEDKCSETGKKYIYAYDDDPDHTMHELGCDVDEVKFIINDLNNRIEKISDKLTDTIIFVVADHGHHNVENLFIKDYKDIEECLLRNTSLEPRAVNFFIRPGMKKIFKERFNKHFGNDFNLYPMEEVIDSKLFGNGEENKVYRDILGDYLAIAKTNKTLLYDGSSILKSQHAGYTDDEIYVPLIVIKTKKQNTYNNTIDYYNMNAKDYFNSTVNADMTKQYDLFLKYLNDNGKILDFGCGSGRDTLYFKNLGYDVDAIDGSEELCKLASAYTGIDVKCMDFIELNAENIYDGIWACSSLVHVNRKSFIEILKKLRKALKQEGIIYLAMKSGDGEEIKEGRYFSYLNRAEFEKIINQIGFKLIDFISTKSVTNKEEKRNWDSYILKKTR